MRILFVSLAAPGHAYPLVPLARAAQAVGHDVHFAVGEEVHAALRSAGLRVFRPADCFYEIYAEDLAPELRRLRPDLVVHEWGVPGAAIAARDAGIRGLWHGFGRMFPDGIGLEMPTEVVDVPHLDICPPSLQDPAFQAAAERIVLRPVAFAPPGVRVEVGEPFVYLTLGTAFGTSERLRSAIAGLAGLGLPVVVAPGRVPVAALGEIPAGVTVAGWVNQAELLPRAALVVHHGGSGTTLGALAAGVPQLLLPQGADQFANAEAVAAAGAGLQLLDGAPIADGGRRLLGDSSFRDAARDKAREIAGMPSPEDVARSMLR